MILVRQDGGAAPAPMPDFSNVSLDSRGGSQIVVVSLFTGLACAVVIARLYVRIFMLKRMGIDDYIQIIALVCSATVLAFFIKEVKLGVGEHIGNPHLMSNFENILYWSYFHSWVIVTGNSSVKLSVGFFLLTLVQGKWYRRFITAWIVFLVIFTLACIGTLVFQCIPVNAVWNTAVKLKPGSKCYSNDTFRSIGLFNGAINIFTDFVFATLPLPVIWPLQMNKRTKISLICILSLGYFACGAAITKEILLAGFFENKDPFYGNDFQIWNVLELTVGMLASSLPALRPLFAFLFDTAASLTSASRRRGNNTNGTGPQGRYYVQQDSVKLSDLPAKGTEYGVSVVAGPRAPSEDGDDLGYTQYSHSDKTSMEHTSTLDITGRDSDVGSDGNILAIRKEIAAHQSPRQRERDLNGRDRSTGIMRTTEIVVSR